MSKLFRIKSKKAQLDQASAQLSADEFAFNTTIRETFSEFAERKQAIATLSASLDAEIAGITEIEGVDQSGPNR